MDKLKQLIEFMNKWKNLPAQRSAQWFADRMFSVGASVMGVLGRYKDKNGKIVPANKYQSIRHLIREKCELEHIDDFSAMNWGCVMEPVCSAFASAVFECEIFEMGAIPNVECGLQRCSPDGVAVVEKLGNKIVSFEFKAPIGRVPNGEVPIYYRAQVMACLCAVEPADLGIFVDVAIRNCYMEDWTFENAQYNEECFAYTFPNGFKKRPTKFDVEDVEALIVGYIYDVEKSYDENQEKVNYGECDKETFQQLMEDCARNKTKRCEFSPIFMKGSDVQPVIEVPAGAIGFIPLKIVLAKIVPIKKQCGFVKAYDPLITAIIDLVREVMKLPLDERAQKIDAELNGLIALQCDIPLIE